MKYIFIIIILIFHRCYSLLNVGMHERSRPKFALTAERANDVKFFDFEYSEGVVKAKKHNGEYKVKDKRDSLPFDVFLEGNGEQKKQLGTFMLDSTCSTGDLVVLLESTYLVKRVTFVYKWEPSPQGLKVIRKKLDVVHSTLLADVDLSEVLQ